MNPSIPLFQRETLEFLPVAVTVDGAPVVEDVEFCVVPSGARPDDFDAPTVLGDAIGVMVDGAALGKGVFEVYARVTDAPEIPVVNAGSFRIV